MRFPYLRYPFISLEDNWHKCQVIQWTIPPQTSKIKKSYNFSMVRFDLWKALCEAEFQIILPLSILILPWHEAINRLATCCNNKVWTISTAEGGLHLLVECDMAMSTSSLMHCGTQLAIFTTDGISVCSYKVLQLQETALYYILLHRL